MHNVPQVCAACMQSVCGGERPCSLVLDAHSKLWTLLKEYISSAQCTLGVDWMCEGGVMVDGHAVHLLVGARNVQPAVDAAEGIHQHRTVHLGSMLLLNGCTALHCFLAHAQPAKAVNVITRCQPHSAAHPPTPPNPPEA